MPDQLTPRSVAAPPGPEWCRAWTQRIDEALETGLADSDIPTGGLAVVALGSYARQELCAASDVDLLLLHDGWHTDDLKALVRGLCYPLWDAGLSVGHAVRTPRQAVVAAGERVDTATALTEHRLIAGDAGLIDDLNSRQRRWLGKSGRKLLVDLSRADADRHAKAGLVPGMLEPDLKNGSGGLRDLHSLRWAGACLLGDVGLDVLVGARYLGAPDRRDLAEANEILTTARCALHLYHAQATGRPGAGGERLRLDLQDDVAAVTGHLSPDAGSQLLRRVGLAMRAIAHIYGRTWPVLLADGRRGRRVAAVVEDLGDGLVLRRGLVEVGDPAALAADPPLGLRAVAVAAQRGTHLGRATTTLLSWVVDDAGTLRWDGRARAALVDVLRCGAAGLAALADADHAGLLTAYLPQWSRIRGRPQRNPFHCYDLDTHGTQAVAELVALGEGDLSGVYKALGDPDAVLLSALLHDVGKAWPGDHSVAGEAVAREWVLNMGFDRGRAEQVARLVRLHLLLPDAATRRDLDDDGELAAVAAQVGDLETLDGLYLLSLADGRATGPSACSAWKEGLIGELHARVRRVLRDDRDPADRQNPEAVVDEARRLLRQRGEPEAFDRLLDGAPRRYIVAAGAERMAEHSRLLAISGGQGLRAAVRAGPSRDTWTLSVVGADRTGLIADCAGVLAGHGVAVLDARAFTSADGIALDWFTVRLRGDGRSGGDGAVGQVDWRRVTDDVRRAGEGNLDVTQLVDRRERRRDERPPALPAPIPVRVRYERAPREARIEVTGPDAPGVLYRVARVLSDTGFDVVGARVATLGPEVRDVFFVRPPPVEGNADDLTARLREAAARRG